MPTPFEQLPDNVRAYAFGTEVSDAASSVAEKYALRDSFPLIPVVKRVLMGEDPSVLIPDALKEAGLVRDLIPLAAVDFTKLALKPIETYIGDTGALITGWGGNPGEPAFMEVGEEEVEEEEEPEVVVETPVPVAVPPVPAPTPVRRPPPPPSPALVRGGDLLAPEDAAELAQHTAKAESVKATSPEISAEPAVRAIVAAAAALLPLSKGETRGPEGVLEAQKRLAKIVEARLKDVRDAYATRAEIEKPASSGGLGLTGSALADLMEKIESAAYEAKRDAEQRTSKEKSAHMERGIARRDAGGASRDQEEQLLARRYAELTGKAPTKTIGAIGARSSLAMSARESVSQAAKKIDNEKVKQAVASSAPPTLRPAAPRPRMEDVRPAHRLAGPVDELRLLNLEDFRRLSKDPKTATAKVLDQAELLRSQGEDQWFAAVKAWRASPLNGWYVKVMQEALSRGMEVRSLLAEKRAAGEIVPTDAEVDALVALNGRLRF